jgi:hypothetical protein
MPVAMAAPDRVSTLTAPAVRALVVAWAMAAAPAPAGRMAAQTALPVRAGRIVARTAVT